MKDERKTKEALIKELRQLRGQVARLERSVARLKRAEESLRIERNTAQRYLDIAGVVLVVIDADQKVSLINKKGCEILGCDEKEIVGKNWFDNFIPEKIRDEVKGVFKRLIDGGIEPAEFFENPVLTRSGEEKIIAWHNTILKDDQGNIQGTLSSGEDITERKRTEDALRENEARYKALFDRSLYCIWVHDFQGRFLDANQAALNLLGYTREEFISLDFASLLDEEQLHKALKKLEEVRRTGSEKEYAEYRLRRKDGDYVWVEAEAFMIYRHGKPYAVQGLARDITERKRAEDELRLSEERFRRLAENAIVGLSLSDSDARLVYVNPATLKMCGYDSLEEIQSRPIEKLITPETLARVMDAMKEKKRLPYWEIDIVRKDGHIRHLEASVSSVNIGGVKLFQSVFIDVTERKRIEDELLRAQRLESIGILAGGIAHDFNNFLAAVMGNISLAIMRTSPQDKAMKNLQEAERACVGARDMIQQILTFSKGGAPIKETASITDIIKNSAGLALRGSNVRCEFFLPDNLWPVEVDVGQMSQVINNLIINADYAMPGGGIIGIGAENLNIGPENVLPLKQGSYVKVIIKDLGAGIAPEDIPRIFDPYFSTKDEGFGLGLATTYSIIKRHEGYIDVESEMGAGTTFHVYLPASDKKLPEKRVSEEKPIIGEGRILVMDSEESIREVISEMLKSLGYEVESAFDGQEAIELYKKAGESGRPFNVVIMDLTVPGGMGGKEAVRELIKIDPGVKVIVSSGYSNDPIMAEYKKYGFSGVIAKPYRIKDLSEVLYNVVILA